LGKAILISLSQVKSSQVTVNSQQSTVNSQQSTVNYAQFPIPIIMKRVFRIFLSLVLSLVLAFGWVLLSATPAFALPKTSINYTNINLSDRDFSNSDLAGEHLSLLKCGEQIFKVLI
jgi:hypothetical protein